MRLLFRIFVDPWIIMLCLGGLGHQLALPVLFISYWPCVLFVIAVQAAWGTQA